VSLNLDSAATLWPLFWPGLDCGPAGSGLCGASFSSYACAAPGALAVGLQKLHFSLADAVAISGVVGTAGTLAALIAEKAPARKARFTVSDAWLTLKENAYEGYQFGATFINEGDQPDILQRIEQQLYNYPLGFIASNMVCGGREVASDAGHVLPIECRPRVLYRVEGTGTIAVRFPYSDPHGKGYALRCKLVFGDAKPVTIRVTDAGLSRSSALTHAFHEAMLRLRTRSKNPFTDFTENDA
jgi:hypothetical protein